MKRLLALSLACIIALALVITNQSISYAADNAIGKVKINSDKDANVRSQASFNGNVIGVAKAGRQYDLLAEQTNWYKIRINSFTVGWIYSDLATIVSRTTPTPKVTPKSTPTPKQTPKPKSQESIYSSLLNELIIKDLMSEFPFPVTSIKSTKEYYANPDEYKRDFLNNAGIHVWRIVLDYSPEDAQYFIFSDEKDVTALFNLKRKGKAAEVLPYCIWEVKLLESIPEIKKIADEYGIELVTIMKVTSDHNCYHLADKNGEIDLMDNVKYQEVLETRRKTRDFFAALVALS